MIESTLMNYGVLGIWTITLLLDKYKSQEQMKKIISKNTEALNKLRIKLNGS